MDPGINGYETYRRILQFQPTQKAIFTSGYFNPDDQDKISALGISQYLTKPFSVTSLAKAVQLEISR
jgi:CheY-like chemotaxis protein